MTWDAMTDAIRTRFGEQIEDVHLVGQVVYDNEPVEGAVQDVTKTWARFSIRPGRALPADTGAAKKRFRSSGVAIAQLFAPLGEGDDASSKLADHVTAAFRLWNSGGVRFRAPYPEVIGRRDGHWQTNVICEFTYDEVAA